MIALCVLYLRTVNRLGHLAGVAERLAAGDLAATVERPWVGHVGRVERALNETADTPERDPRRGDHRPADPGRQPRARSLATLDQEVERAIRHERPLSIAFADIDHFKDINDTHGHHIGDIVLRTVADLFRSNLRVSDVVGRFGGEEFMLVLPEAMPEEATDVAEKVRVLVERYPFEGAGGARIPVTVSIGIAGGHGPTLQMDALIQAADQAMYAAKSMGRNQTYVFREPDDDARVPGAPISSAGRARALEVGAIGRRAAEVALSAMITPLPHYRGKPSSLIATIAVEMARDLALPPQEVERIRVASLLHDIGKIAVPEEILEKPAPLTDSRVELRPPAPAHRPAHHRRGGRPARRGQDHPPSPRALRRPRLPARPARQGHPARLAHRGHRRRLRRDGPRPAVQGLDEPRGRPRGDAPPRGHPVRSRSS